MKSVDLIGHSKFHQPWRQLDGCSVTRPYLSAKGVAYETNLDPGHFNMQCTSDCYLHHVHMHRGNTYTSDTGRS